MKVLVYTSPARGHLYPIVPIASALARRGHEISICTLSGELRHLAPLGFDGAAIDPTIERNQLEDWRARTPLGNAVSVLRTFAARAADEMPDLTRAIARRDPDLLVIDVNCWGAAIVAEASGLPWASYCPYLLPLPSRDAPAYGPGLAPLNGPLDKARNALVRRIGDRRLDGTAVPALNALRARHGLPPVAHFVDVFARPPLLLAFTAEGFEYPRSDWPANVRLVGPMNWAPADAAGQPPNESAERSAVVAGDDDDNGDGVHGHGAPSTTTVPAWFADIGDPFVLVTCSTERQRDGRLAGVALQGLPPAGMSVLATTAAHDPTAFHAPTGSKVVRFVAHDAIIPRAACVVCHGGLGITQKALAAGVPVVVVPFGRDQMETARRVEVAAAGVRLPPRRLNPVRLAQAVRTAIGLRAGAERVSRTYAAAGGPTAAADAIEGLVAGEVG